MVGRLSGIPIAYVCLPFSLFPFRGRQFPRVSETATPRSSDCRTRSSTINVPVEKFQVTIRPNTNTPKTLSRQFVTTELSTQRNYI